MAVKLPSFLKTSARYFQKLFSWEIKPGVGYAAALGTIVSVLGLRDVGINSLLAGVFGFPVEGIFLEVVYWLVLIISLVVFAIFLYQNLIRILGTFPIQEIMIWFLLAVPYFYILFNERLWLDFWLDEVISIIRHIQPSLKSSVFSYPVPNNHIFSNLISGMYLQIIGFQDLRGILAHPFGLRSLYLLVSLASILLMGWILYDMLDAWAARISIILLCTTIPYLNFAVQVRGYSFSILFCTAMIGLIYSFLKQPQKWKRMGISFLAFSLFYTIPSNIYFLAAVITSVAVDGLMNHFKGNDDKQKRENISLIKQPEARIILDIIFGILIGFLVYFPLLDKILNNQYVKTQGLFQGNVFPTTFLRIFKHLISKRWVLLAAGGLGLIFMKGTDDQGWDIRISRLMAGMIFLPFGFSFLRGDNPFPRVFLVILPSLIVLWTIGLHRLIHKLTVVLESDWFRWPAVILLIILIANGIFIYNLHINQMTVYDNLVHEKRNQIENVDTRLWASHFLSHYEVFAVVETISQTDDQRLITIDDENTVYEWVVYTYLKTYDFHPQDLNQLVKDPQEDDFFLISSFPNTSIAKINDLQPQINCFPANDVISIYRIYSCKFP